MGVQKTPYLKTYELQTGMQDFSVDFVGANRQLEWIEISLVFDKTDKHVKIYESYNAECAARMIKLLEFANISEEYSTTNTLRYDTSNDLQKHLLYKQLVAWHTNGCSAAPITDFVKNPIAQEQSDEDDHFGRTSDEIVYIDLQDSRGYTNKLEKPSQNDSKMIITIQLKKML